MDRREAWNRVWAKSGYHPPWKDRGISPQLEAAVKSGRCRPPGRVLDIGCGEGVVAAWFAAQGFEALGFDFAAPVIARARTRHGGSGARFEVVDAVRGPIPGGPYDILVDRGCFHGLPALQRPGYVANVAAVAAPGAPFFLYIRAFRGKYPGTAEQERLERLRKVRALFGRHFDLVRAVRCDIGAGAGGSSTKPLPGLFILMRRKAAS